MAEQHTLCCSRHFGTVCALVSHFQASLNLTVALLAMLKPLIQGARPWALKVMVGLPACAALRTAAYSPALEEEEPCLVWLENERINSFLVVWFCALSFPQVCSWDMGDAQNLHVA